MKAFLLLNGWAALVALLLAVASAGTRPASRFLLRALGGYLVTIHSAVLWSGLAGQLTIRGLAIVLTGASALAAWRLRRLRREARIEPRIESRPGAPATVVEVYPLLAAFVGGAVWAQPHLLDATRLWIWDDYTYHMVYPALWLREHAIHAVEPAHAFTMQAWYPLSASVVAAWFMVPFQGARGEALAWVSLTGLLYAGLFACGAAELLRRLGCRRGAWAIAFVLFATSHRITVMASSFSDADLAQAALLFAGFACATPPGDAESRRDVRDDAWSAGLLTGIALGVKATAAIPSLVILSMLVRRAAARSPESRGGVRAMTQTALVFGVTWAATGAYWYARNVAGTGNPLYPGRFFVWPGTTFPETSLLEYSRRYGASKTVRDAVAVYLNWSPLHGTLAVAGLLGLAGWLLWRRQRLTRPQTYFAAGVLAITAASVSLLPLAPFSAGNAMTFRSGFVHWDSMRYVALLALLGWAALAALFDAAGRLGRGAAVVVSTACLLVPGDARLASWMLLVGLMLGAIAVARAQGWISGPRVLAPRHRAGAADALAVLLAGLVLVPLAGLVLWRHDVKATAGATSLHREPLFGAAAAVLDGQPPGTRVAVFGDQWIYPAFGARDHLVPVRLDGDGHVAATPVGDAMGPGPLTVAPSTLLANLRAAGVDVVVVLHLPHPGRSPEFPAQHAALEVSEGARLLLRHAAFAIWGIDRGRTQRPE